MIDIHAHVIPGVDDGPKDMETAIDLLRQAAARGVTAVIATPHFHLPNFNNFNTFEQFQLLKEAVRVHRIPIDLHLGNEIHVDEDTLEYLMDGGIYTLAKTTYVLLELPYTQLYPVHLELISKIQRMGYKVILAHIDRYPYFTDQPDRLKDLIDRGCYGQINATHCLKRPKETKGWLEAGYVHFVASDMHCPSRRPCLLNEAKRQLRKHVNESWIQRVFVENPTALLENRNLMQWPTQSLKKHWLRRIIG